MFSSCICWVSSFTWSLLDPSSEAYAIIDVYIFNIAQGIFAQKRLIVL